MSSRRSNGDESTVTRRWRVEHGGQRRASDVEHASEVDVDHCSPCVIVGLPKRGATSNGTSGSDDNIDRTVMCHNGVDDASQCFGIANVSSVGVAAAIACSGCFIEVLPVCGAIGAWYLSVAAGRFQRKVDQCHGEAARGEPGGSRCPNSPSCSGNNGNRMFTSHDCSSPRTRILRVRLRGRHSRC